MPARPGEAGSIYRLGSPHHLEGVEICFDALGRTGHSLVQLLGLRALKGFVESIIFIGSESLILVGLGIIISVFVAVVVPISLTVAVIDAGIAITGTSLIYGAVDGTIITGNVVTGITVTGAAIMTAFVPALRVSSSAILGSVYHVELVGGGHGPLSCVVYDWW